MASCRPDTHRLWSVAWATAAVARPACGCVLALGHKAMAGSVGHRLASGVSAGAARGDLARVENLPPFRPVLPRARLSPEKKVSISSLLYWYRWAGKMGGKILAIARNGWQILAKVWQNGGNCQVIHRLSLAIAVAIARVLPALGCGIMWRCTTVWWFLWQRCGGPPPLLGCDRCLASAPRLPASRRLLAQISPSARAPCPSASGAACRHRSP